MISDSVREKSQDKSHDESQHKPQDRSAVHAYKGRGAVSNDASRFLPTVSVPVDDGWDLEEPPAPHPQTQLLPDRTVKLISRNKSPDIPFDRSINPYKGCEHGCIYCFARPTHAYLDLSPGLDFETRIFFKTDVRRRLEAELSAMGRQS